MTFLMAPGGGTGGHIFPALTVAEEVRKNAKNTKFLFVGASRGLGSVLVGKKGFDYKAISGEGLKGKGIGQRVKSLFMLPRTFWAARSLLKELSPHAVLGIGGYASGPLLLYSALSGRKTAILEPNAVPGFSNRILGRFSTRIFLAFDEARPWFSGSKCVVTGIPIRPEILALSPPSYKETLRTILVFGGSQGAHQLNQALVEMLPHISKHRNQWRFIHQTGKQDLEWVEKSYREAGFEAQVREFFDDMAGVYARSDFIVARSGSSVLEIVACGRPSLLVPYPFAADDHQKANAQVLEKQGAAIVISDSNLKGEVLAEQLSSLLADRVRLEKMREAAVRLRKSEAAKAIGDWLVACAPQGGSA